MSTEAGFISPWRWLLLVGLVVGILYALVVPPFQVPDETHHFYRAYHLSEGHLMGERRADRRLGGYLPASLEVIQAPFAHLRFQPEARIAPAALRNAAAVPLRPDQRRFLDFPNTGYYAPLPYLPYAAAFIILRPLKLPPFYLLYAGRIAGLLCWLFLAWHALRLFPYHRYTMAFCALLPASLFVHAGLSGDTLTNGLAFYLLARLLALHFTQGRRFDTREGLLLAALSAAITFSKVVFAPLITLCWLIPADRFTSPGTRRGWCGGLLLLQIGVLGATYHLSSSLFIPYDAYHPDFRDGRQINPGVDPAAQWHYLWQHPLDYAATVFHSFRESLPATMAHYTGKFGWEKNYLPAPLIGLLLLTLLALSLFENGTHPQPSPSYRAALIGLAAFMSLGLATVLYLQWHPVGAPRIIALMGRYFIPIFPLLWLSMKLPQLHLPPAPLLWWSSALNLLALAWGSYAVVQRYYQLG